MSALIFDMDGVIVDSTATHAEAWRVYLHSHGLNFDNLADHMLGKHNDQLVRDFFPADSLTEDMIYHHGASKEQLYRDLMGPMLEQRLVPGVREFLLRANARPMAVATNAEPANVEFVFDVAAIRQHFRAIVSGHDVARPKPFPDVYLRAAELLGVTPSDCVVFEDSITGVQSALAAGSRVVGISTTLREIPGVHLMIRDFLDPTLEVWLQELTVAQS